MTSTDNASGDTPDLMTDTVTAVQHQNQILLLFVGLNR